MRKHRGSTIVEVIVLMLFSSSLLMVAIGAVHQSMQLSRGASARLSQVHTINRCAEQFRIDCHYAFQARTESENQIVLEFNESMKVIYLSKNNLFVRESWEGERLVKSEELVLGRTSAVKFSLKEDTSLATFTIETIHDTQPDKPRVDRTVRALIGLICQPRRRQEELP